MPDPTAEFSQRDLIAYELWRQDYGPEVPFPQEGTQRGTFYRNKADAVLRVLAPPESAPHVDRETYLLRKLVQDVARWQGLRTTEQIAARDLYNVLRALSGADEETLDYWGLDHSLDGYKLLTATLLKEYPL